MKLPVSLHWPICLFCISLSWVVAGCGSEGDAGTGGTEGAAGMSGTGGSGPACGNGAVEGDEECDDGNLAYGDGCDSACLREDVCVITHNGGTPLSLTTVRVDRAGATSIVDTRTLDGNDEDAAFGQLQAVTVCGTHVYAVQRGSASIAILEAAPSGALTPKDEVEQAGIVSVHCLPEDNTLIALSGPDDGTAFIAATAYSIGADGLLRLVNAIDLTVDPDSGAYSLRQSLPALVHPTTGELWVVGYFLGISGTTSAAFRVGISGAGSVQIEEGPADMGSSIFGSAIAIGNGETQMVMAGDGPGCTSVWSLPGDFSLPTQEDRLSRCDPDFSNGTTVASRDSDDVFYQGHSGSSVRIHDVPDTVNFVREAATTTPGRLLQLLYEDTVLFTVGRNDGEVTTFSPSIDGKTLTEVDPTTTVPVTGIKGLTTIGCR